MKETSRGGRELVPPLSSRGCLRHVRIRIVWVVCDINTLNGGGDSDGARSTLYPADVGWQHESTEVYSVRRVVG